MPPVLSPSTVRVKGFAHPRILAIARVLTDAGWRVTSIYRPGAPSHSKGIALDVAPMIMHVGGFGPRTAQLIYDTLVTAGYPDVTVVSEDDHVHIELAARFAPGPGVLTQEGLVMNPNMYSIVLPESPIGDVYDDGPAQVFDFESGDVIEYDEQGGPRRKKRKAKRKARRQKIKKAFGAIATGGASLAISGIKKRKQKKAAAALAKRRASPTPQARAMGAAPLRLSSSAAQKADPMLVATLNARKQIQHAASPDVLFERYNGVGDRVSGELPPNARLRPADVAAASTLIMSNPVFAPQVFAPTSAVGSTITFVINTMLQAVLPATTIFDWVGDILKLSASILNAAPLTFSVVRTLGGVATTWTYVIPAMTNASELTLFNGRLVAAVPRFAAQAVTVGPVADANNQIVITGLPVANYSATLRCLVPGDSSVEGLLAKMV